ncbi:sodium-coupled neutral amino acid transporter 9-like isoform X2 [Vespa crabro]|uniref:sodium-coupled neutral amino acid transporter 9-like isoform X2 n=1 Tax=Vespa crabro TaxID=7445 RepID=UPI001F00FE0F|nr:sodium-coupled neutral amino acid transporter 9-like isoform X2 [Vespa crabro]
MFSNKDDNKNSLFSAGCTRSRCPTGLHAANVLSACVHLRIERVSALSVSVCCPGDRRTSLSPSIPSSHLPYYLTSPHHPLSADEDGSMPLAPSNLPTRHFQYALVSKSFSIWNTILGSSLLTMPWGIQMAGFFPGIILVLAMGALCLYTAYRLIVVHQYHGSRENIEVVQLSRIYLNKWVEYIARIFSISVLLGAMIAYWILMSNFLYNSVNFFYDNVMGLPTYSITDNNTDIAEILCTRKEMYNGSDIIMAQERTFDALGPAWDLHKTVPAFLAIIIFPLLNFNSTTFFTKFNSLGTVSIIYIIIFVLIKSASWGIHMDKAMWEISWVLKPTFPALSGMLALSFFIHNIIITIMQSNCDQSKNGRDLTIAYGLVTITYIIVGVSFFLCFPLAKSCIQDNLLNNFKEWDALTIVARIVLLFQLLTVYPLLTYMLRIQLISSVCKTSTIYSTLITNFILISICILFATFLPYIGTVIRYTGALSGLIYVFTLPCLLHLSFLRKQGKLTTISTIVHLIIPIIGILNLIAQFFIVDH